MRLVQCGSDNDSSETTTPSTNTTTTVAASGDCPDTALAAFVTHVAPAINGTCSSCHATNPTRKFVSGQNAENRTALLAYTGADAQKLKTKIHSAANHQGGNQSANLSSDKIDAWMAAEIKCAN
jgi:uncharacterized membrane protein